jgi:hypothetical protein
MAQTRSRSYAQPNAGLDGWMSRGMDRMLAAICHPLPDFLILGAHKAGTTSLYSYLSQHPQVLPASRKELHFFSKHFARGAGWYRRRFPKRARMKRRRNRTGLKVICGEATPYYLFHPHAPARISRLLPNARLIVLLRDPVARAFSHYQHECRLGHETLSFDEALARESSRVDAELAHMLRDPAYYSFNHQHFAYRLRGVYVDQILAYRRLFAPEQMLILSSDQLFQDPQTAYSMTLRFLGLQDARLKHANPMNAGAYDRHAIPMRDDLENFFRPHNRRLYDLLQCDLGWPADPTPDAVQTGRGVQGVSAP